ncbi:MAG: hypothetical protein KBH45_03460, partial [Verrucomicrobia bacterium]|nr:hypothetical protein [Verrucomicrobiota bacterium]
MKFSAVMVLLVAASQTMLAQPGSPASRPVRSVSGEFIVSDARSAAGAGAMPGAARTDQNRLALEPAFLAVTCERVKQALYADLGVTTLSRGIVNITIRSIRGTYRELAYTTERFGNNWIYRLDLPPQVERHQLLRVLVQVLLQEMANRTATDHLAEIPAWLTEGFTQQLLNSRGVEIILPPPNQSFGALMLGPTVLQARQRDPLEDARRVLHDRPPLSIAELSWLGANQMNSAAGETFRCSAQLFVSELLALPQGREHLRTMINDLANCYNWQTAFLRAFAPHFANQLAVEKWWTLQVVHFVGRDPMNLWTGAESWQKLADLLRTSVAVRRTSAEMPAHVDVTLQAIIREWEPLRQTPTIRSKINELELAQLRVAPEFMVLVDDYRRALTAYLERRERA